MTLLGASTALSFAVALVTAWSNRFSACLSAATLLVGEIALPAVRNCAATSFWIALTCETYALVALVSLDPQAVAFELATLVAGLAA